MQPRKAAPAGMRCPGPGRRSVRAEGSTVRPPQRRAEKARVPRQLRWCAPDPAAARTGVRASCREQRE